MLPAPTPETESDFLPPETRLGWPISHCPFSIFFLPKFTNISTNPGFRPDTHHSRKKGLYLAIRSDKSGGIAFHHPIDQKLPVDICLFHDSPASRFPRQRCQF